jgi:hypothetical protein
MRDCFKKCGMLVITCLLAGLAAAQDAVGYNPFPCDFQVINSNATIGGSSTNTFNIFFDFYKAGVTDLPGQGAGGVCRLLLRRYDTLKAAGLNNATPVYATYTASYVSDNGNNDTYQVTLPTGLPNGRYSWECECDQGAQTYRSWDYLNNTGTLKPVTFTVGYAGIYRSMLVVDTTNAAPAKLFYDMRQFKPGNRDLPNLLAGPYGLGGFCTTGKLLLKGAEINVYKNKGPQTNQVTDITGGRLYYRLRFDSASLPGIPPCAGATTTWKSMPLDFFDNCVASPPGVCSFYNFPTAGSCDYKNGNELDQKWAYTDSAINLMQLAADSLCQPSDATGTYTYALDVYTEADAVVNAANVTLREPETGYHTMRFSVVSADSLVSANGFAQGLGCYYILPLRIIDFRVQAVGDALRLRWELNEPRDAVRFHIQHSADGVRFTTIHSLLPSYVPQWGNSYTFFLSHVANNVAGYYRLKVTDRYQKDHYSTITRQVSSATDNMPYTLLQNPVQERLWIENSSGKANRLLIDIIDVMGRKMLQANLAFSSGNAIQSLALPAHLPAGMYYLRATDAQGKPWTTRFVKE